MNKQPPAKIVRGWLCEKCGAELKTNDEYKQHKIDHTAGKIPDEVVDPVEGDEPNTMTPGDKIESIDHAVQEIMETAPKPSIFAADPITLKYAYEGNCPTCNIPVQTIPMEISGRHKKYIVIACCPKCWRNVMQREVVKL